VRILVSTIIAISVFSLMHVSMSVGEEAREAKVVLRSTVVGNQEQPKVLYIVPWQRAGKLQLSYQPLQSLVDGVFSKIEREEFLRQLKYREKIEDGLIDAPQ